MSGAFEATDGLTAQARRAVPVTPNDSANLPELTPKALWVSAAGTVTVIPAGQEADTGVALGDLPAGTVIPIRVRRVMATGTTATVLALY